MLVLPLLIAATAATAAPPSGAREVGKGKVEADGSRVFVSQASGTAWPAGTPRLVLRCAVVVERGELKWIKHTSRTKEAYLFYGAGLPKNQGDFTVTFGDDPEPRKYSGEQSTDGKSLFVRGKFSNLDPFLRSLLEHSNMTVVLKPKGEAPMPPLSFDLAQLGEALSEWREACPIK